MWMGIASVGELQFGFMWVLLVDLLPTTQNSVVQPAGRRMVVNP
jgi:hypothetical protein